MSLVDWTLVVFGAQTRLAVWLPLAAYLAWSVLVRACGLRSPRSRYWSLLALFALLPLVFVIPLVAGATHSSSRVLERLVSVPAALSGPEAETFPWLARLVVFWPYFLIPLGVACALGLGLLEYGIAALRLGLTRKQLVEGVFVLETPGLRAFTFGLLRPRVFVSKAVWEGSHREAVLAHERAHARRRDPLVLFWARAIRRSTLYLPFGARVYRELLLEAERACDEAGARAVGVRCYAEALLDFAEPSTARSGTARARRLGPVPTALSFGAPELVGVLAVLPVLQVLSTRASGGWVACRVRALLTPSSDNQRPGLFWFGFVLVYLVVLRIP